MMQDEIIEMAREAHRKLVTEVYVGHLGQLDPWTIELLKIFANLVAAKTLAQPVSSHGNAENLYIEMSKHLNCPHCGGSGHIDDVAQPEQEPVAWPCLIAEADFSENTVILAMQCTDYKVSAGNHWLSNTPPQRTWVGLTPDEIRGISLASGENLFSAIMFTHDKLKEKNT